MSLFKFENLKSYKNHQFIIISSGHVPEETVKRLLVTEQQLPRNKPSKDPNISAIERLINSAQ
jgi:hypothetical protein